VKGKQVDPSAVVILHATATGLPFQSRAGFDQNPVLNFKMSRVFECTIPLNKLLERLINSSIKIVHLWLEFVILMLLEVDSSLVDRPRSLHY